MAQYADNGFYVFGPDPVVFRSRPRPAVDLSVNTPTGLYNGMIAPLLLYGIRGVIWYQGESNTGNPKEYERLFPVLIENWRNDFGQEDLHFYFVQIAPFTYGAGTESQFLREAQMSALNVPHTGMAVTLDIGDPNNIHPANKQEVGRSLARWALAKTFGRKIPYSGPLFRSMHQSEGAIELHFDHAENGLVIHPGEKGSGFLIAGADRVFKGAVVSVRGSVLSVYHPDIAAPVAVRYAFDNAPEATLFNAEGLPAPSFRTDDWE